MDIHSKAWTAVYRISVLILLCLIAFLQLRQSRYLYALQASERVTSVRVTNSAAQPVTVTGTVDTRPALVTPVVQ